MEREPATNVSINTSQCIGCALCAKTCPGVFRMDGDRAVVCADPVPHKELRASMEAAEQCPVGAITLN